MRVFTLKSWAIYFLILTVLLNVRCTNAEQKEMSILTDNISTIKTERPHTPVKTSAVVLGDFPVELLSNGVVRARNKCSLVFGTSSRIEQVNIRNGDRVKKGQVLVRLADFKLKNEYAQQLERVESAKLTLYDLLVGMGFSLKDTVGIEPDIMETLLLKSGLREARNSLALANYNLSLAEIVAPYSGVVSELACQPFNMATSGSSALSIIDDTEFTVEFPVLESDYSLVKKGGAVKVVPYAKLAMEETGTIIEVNPQVLDGGLIRLRAICSNKSRMLIEGMNVKIRMQNNIHNQLYVPKEAVIQRSGRSVIFTCINNEAQWNYVNLGLENSTSIQVLDGLKEGDVVIYEGNLNLEHGANVILNKP